MCQLLEDFVPQTLYRCFAPRPLWGTAIPRPLRLSPSLLFHNSSSVLDCFDLEYKDDTDRIKRCAAMDVLKLDRGDIQENTVGYKYGSDRRKQC